VVVNILYLEKFNECFNDIDLKNIFKNFLWEEKKVIIFWQKYKTDPLTFTFFSF